MVIVAGQGIGTDLGRVADQKKAAVITSRRYRTRNQVRLAQIIIGN